MKKRLFGIIIAMILLIPLSYSIGDADLDGVPDAEDACPESKTYVVDSKGCSCEQKSCEHDNDQCTDDCVEIDGLATCAFRVNKEKCPASKKEDCIIQGYHWCISGYGKGVHFKDGAWDGDGSECWSECGSVLDSKDVLKETVKCVFSGSYKNQKCYNSMDSYCYGVESCSVDIKGKKGENVYWKSSCEGYPQTVIDGVNEHAYFECSESEYDRQKRRCVGAGYNWCVIGTGAGSHVENGMLDYGGYECWSECYAEGKNLTGNNVNEIVKCVFEDSNYTEKCYSEKYECNGIESCALDVKGKKGEKIMWKSSCGGYAYTIMDGENEHAKFGCSQREDYNVLPPKPPFDLKISTEIAENSKISKLYWKNIDGESFNVYKNKDNSEFQLLEKTTDRYFKDDSGLSRGIKYGYYVTAIKQSQESNSSNIVYAYPDLKSCAEQGGDSCLGSRIVCPGKIMPSSDSERCCAVKCATQSQQFCSQCGKGIFNSCDRDECNRISEACYFIPSKKCYGCFGAVCESYTDKQTCAENHCNLEGCSWTGKICATLSSV